MFSQKEINLRQRKLLDLLKDYNMSVLYQIRKSNVVVGAFSRMSMRSVAHDNVGKKEVVKDVHRLVGLGVQLEDSTKVSFMIHRNS